MKKLVSLVLLLASGIAFADISSRLNIRTQDGTVNTYPFRAKFTNGSVTDNNDGTVSISAGGSASLNIPQTAVAVGTSSNTVTGDSTIFSADLTNGQVYLRNVTASTTTLILDVNGFALNFPVITFRDNGADKFSWRYSQVSDPESRFYFKSDVTNLELLNFSRDASSMTALQPFAFRGTVCVSSGMLDGNGSPGTLGQLWKSNGPNTVPTWTTSSGGGITLQEIQFSTTTRTTTTSATPANTAMTLSITLAGSGSCVEISASGSVTNDNSAGNSNWGIGLKRGNTLLGQSLYGFQTGQGKAAAGAYDPYSIHFIDKPLTAGATTYTVVFAADNGQAVLTPTVVGEPGILILKELSSCTKSGPF